MRTFRLYDNDGNRYNITSKDNLFFYKIDGLGFSQDAEFQRIEDRYALLNNYISQNKITGIIRFWQPQAELDYFNFAQFCQNQPIMMDYNNNYGISGNCYTKNKINDMNKIAISQIIEQFFRVILGIGLAYFLMASYGAELGAAGAIMGATIGAIGSILYLIITSIPNFLYPFTNSDNKSDSIYCPSIPTTSASH